jgi:hypothetical protein
MKKITAREGTNLQRPLPVPTSSLTGLRCQLSPPRRRRTTTMGRRRKNEGGGGLGMVWRLKKGCGRAEAATLGQCKTATMGGGAGRRAAAGWIVRGVGLKEKRVRLTPADPPYHPTSAKCRSGAHYSDSCILRQARPPATAFSGDPQASPITTAYGPHRSPPCSTGRHAGSAAAQLCTSLHYSDARHAAPPPSAGRRVGPTAALLRRPPSVAALGPPPRCFDRLSSRRPRAPTVQSRSSSKSVRSQRRRRWRRSSTASCPPARSHAC